MSFQRLGIHLTDRCQLDCAHCLRDPALKPQDVPLALIERLLPQARRLYGIRHVSLTGGEPTLHPEFLAVIDRIVDQGFTWDMVTNGKRLPAVLKALDARAERVRALRTLALSVDGATEASHDRIRGKGSFRNVMTAAALCGVRGIRLSLKMAVNALNVAEVEQLGLMAAQLGAAEVDFAITQPTGTHLDASMFLPAREWRSVQDRVRRLSGALAIRVVLAEGFPRDERFPLCGPFKSETLHVDARGRLTLCCAHSGVPDGGREADVAADLNTVSLLEAHQRLLALIHSAQKDTLEEMERRPEPTDWELFPCNSCMRRFGKPHWTEAGAAGPGARRERWPRPAQAPAVAASDSTSAAVLPPTLTGS